MSGRGRSRRSGPGTNLSGREPVFAASASDRRQHEAIPDHKVLDDPNHILTSPILSSMYLVGCDGSVIRNAAGIEFPGCDPTTSGLIAEVEMTEEPEPVHPARGAAFPATIAESFI